MNPRPPCRHPHGDRRRYRATSCHEECHCQPCRDACARYVRRRVADNAAGVNYTTPATEAANQITAWQAAGIGLPQIAKATGLNARALWRLTSRPHARVHTATVQAVLSADPQPALVSALGAQRRLQALSAAGYTFTRIAEMMGRSDRAYLARVARGHRPSLTVVMADAIAAVYTELATVLPPVGPTAKQIRSGAENKGWEPIEAWTGLDIDDPAAQPWAQLQWSPEQAAELDDRAVIEAALAGTRRSRQLTIAQRRAVVKYFAVHLGLNDQEIERRTGIAGRTVLRIRHELARAQTDAPADTREAS